MHNYSTSCLKFIIQVHWQFVKLTYVSQSLPCTSERLDTFTMSCAFFLAIYIICTCNNIHTPHSCPLSSPLHSTIRYSGTNEPTSISPFPHIFLDYHSEPVTGVLLRQLTAKLIHCSLGDLPYSASFLPRLLLWTVDVWLLYNHLVQSLDLPELTCGIKNFLQCPIESKDPEVIINWICSIWNLHLAPSIENTLQQSNSRLSTLVTSTSPGPHHVGQFDSASLSLVQSNQTIEQHRYKALMQLLLACTRLVFLPTCPLQLEMRLKVIDQLTSRLEGLVGVSAGAARHREKLPSDMHKNGNQLLSL